MDAKTVDSTGDATGDVRCFLRGYSISYSSSSEKELDLFRWDEEPPVPAELFDLNLNSSSSGVSVNKSVWMVLSFC